MKNQNYISFAIKAHGNQIYGELPYAYHLAKVVEIVQEIYNSDSSYELEILRAAAWLHDVIEDTDVTYAQVASQFGDAVADIVWACTGVGENRKERNASIYKKLEGFRLGTIVKIADRLANIRHGLETGNTKKSDMYKKEHSAFCKAVVNSASDRAYSILLNVFD